MPTSHFPHREDEATLIEAADSPYQVRVFGDLQDERNRIIGALMDEQTAPTLRLATKLLGCCRQAMVFTDSGEHQIRLSERRCRSRVCPRCRKFRSREVQHRLLSAITKMDARRFVSLTLRSIDEPLTMSLARMRKAFANLRRTPFWKSCVVGGVYCIEVTFNPETRQWHPHIHAVVDGSYIRKNELSDAWRIATGDSYIVDIRLVKSASGVASYVAKYVAKSDDASKIPDWKIAEWAASIHGMRLVHSFGNLHGVKLVDKPEPRQGVHDPLVNPSVLAKRSANGDRVAESILRRLSDAASLAGEEDHRELIDRVKTWQAWVLLELKYRSAGGGDEARPPPQERLFE